MVSDFSRRAFLQRASALSIAGAATPFVLNLAAIGEAAAATASDYKAIVCVFLYGGNDYANTLIPADTANYNAYNAQRSALAYSQAAWPERPWRRPCRWPAGGNMRWRRSWPRCCRSSMPARWR